MENVIQLITDKSIQVGEKRFTRVMGGFGENKPVITDLQVAELLGYSKGARAVRQRLENINNEGKKNIDNFIKGQDIIDLKEGVPQEDTLKETLISLGYAKASISQAKNIYIFSQAGFLLYLKFAEGDKALELYKNFIEDYFKTKAENIVMQKTLEETKDDIIEERKYILGSIIIENDSAKKIELMERDKKLEERVKEIDITLSKKKLMEQLQDKLEIADRFTNNNALYDIGYFSKILDIPKMGRTNMFKWLKESKILMDNKEPYANQKDHFKVIPIDTGYFKGTKTLIKAKGIPYLVKRLIKDNYIESKNYNDVIEKLDNELKTA